MEFTGTSQSFLRPFKTDSRLSQERIEPGQTLGLVILGSDKTHLTVGQGDKECHAVYMSCGNIKKSLHGKVGAHCWMMIAQIPVAKFKQLEYQGILAN